MRRRGRRARRRRPSAAALRLRRVERTPAEVARHRAAQRQARRRRPALRRARPRASADVPATRSTALLAAVLVLNAAAVGVALGAYGGRLSRRRGCTCRSSSPRSRSPAAHTCRHADSRSRPRRSRASRRCLRAAARGRRDARDLRLAREARDESVAARPAARDPAASGCPPRLLAWIYVSTHDLGAHLAPAPGAADHVTWPPAARSGAALDGPRRSHRDAARRRRHRAPAARDRRAAARGSPSSSAGCIIAGARARATTRWELRLGRDDLANPYRVQEAFEGIAGAIASRWYERLWRGSDHFALEIHRLPDLSIRFTVAAPRDARARDPRAARGPLPRRRADRGRRPPDLGATRRAAQEARARSCSRSRPRATTSTPSPSRSSRCSPRTSTRLTVQLVLTPAPGFVHRRARRLLKRRERALQHADHARPRRARHRLGRRSQGAQGRARAPAPLAAVLRPARHRPRPRRRSAASPACSRSCAPRTSSCAAQMRLRRRALRPPDRAGAAEPAARAARRRALDVGAGDAVAAPARARQARPRCRARPSGARSRRRRSSATPSAMLLRDERGPVSIAAADRKYGHALIGGQGGGKSSVMARHFANDARDPDRAVDPDRPQGPARRALPRPRARRAHRPLPRPRPPRDRLQPARRSTPAPARAPPSSCRR